MPKLLSVLFLFATLLAAPGVSRDSASEAFRQRCGRARQVDTRGGEAHARGPVRLPAHAGAAVIGETIAHIVSDSPSRAARSPACARAPSRSWPAARGEEAGGSTPIHARLLRHCARRGDGFELDDSVTYYGDRGGVCRRSSAWSTTGRTTIASWRSICGSTASCRLRRGPDNERDGESDSPATARDGQRDFDFGSAPGRST